MRERGYEDYQYEPSTGLFALEYALLHDCPKKVFLFGYNFYQTGWYGGKTKKYKQENIDKAKAHIERLVLEFCNVTFYGASDFSVDAPNWKKI